MIKLAIISHGKSVIRFESSYNFAFEETYEIFFFFLNASSRMHTDYIFGGHFD